MPKQIILIGGAPTTGKSTIARNLSKHLGLPWLSTDQIREIMKTATTPEANPNLYLPIGYEKAKKFLTELTAEEIATREMNQGNAVWPGIKYLIEDDWSFREGFILEGVNILPHCANEYKDDKRVKSVFLVDEDSDRAKDIIFTRGLFDSPDRYSDDLKEKEVEWVALFSHKLKKEVEKYKYPWVEVTKGEDDLPKVLKALQL